MAPPVPYRNNMRVVIIILLIVCSACEHRPMQSHVIPAVWVPAADNSFHQQQGVLLYNQQPFSGYQYTLFLNGDTAMITPFSNGRISGIAKQWHEHKQLKEVRLFENGQKTGEHRGWWPNGQLQFVYHFNNDVFEGTVQEWFANGQLFRKMYYIQGHENGLQQIWQPNGVVFANYEVRNGRNYGLTGTMHCKNQWTINNPPLPLPGGKKSGIQHD